MFLDALELADLPPLAWGLLRRAHPGHGLLLHGRDVVVGDDFVAEGAWTGPLDGDGFRMSPILFGTGFHETPDGALVLRGPPHSMERLWAVEWTEAVAVSNSLPFALALAGSGLDPEFLHYEADLLTFLRGPGGMRRVLPTRDGRRLSQHSGMVLILDADLRLRSERDRSREERLPPVRSFHHYRAHLTDACAALLTNLADPGRPRRYAPLATLSKGYDSPACAVVARECGAEAAITFREARRGFPDADDDGTDIGRALGLTVSSYDRNAYREGDGSAERYALAGGGGGEDVILASLGDALRGRALVTGYMGDSVWGLRPNPDLVRGEAPYPGGASLGEQRIQGGWIHLSLPWIDLFRQPDIAAISTSAEMAPWRLGGEYDRPIPRRIAEEAGVPREAFGRTKKATSAPLYYDGAVDESLGPAARASFEAWLVEHGSAASLERYRRAWERRSPLLELRERAADFADRRPVPGFLERALRKRLCDRWRRAPAPSLLAVTWAVEQVRQEYRAVLRQAGV